ncbi:nucleotide sugar dehydrogenase [Algiphilus sp. NNCM1]|uniref:nucleotide sugar dehydrogenase n=1 Tax=Algiphilus sp. TaxID=1872431 RepID=UPI001CA63969|nr:nucleotide sugar dehydrogenase [Algiphilus sp.]MBY8965028.1 nucleotide sugar dehydrogenase [Algiphilus acroporae]MCI5104184.1 nucleotide sugar dehydrogenase [Algiphilus sp.]
MNPTVTGIEDARIAVIGLGYVGLPLAAAFGEKTPTIGFDIDANRIAELESGHDRTRELEPHELQRSHYLQFSSEPGDIAHCNVYIVTVPTPIDRHKRPDLGPLCKASETVGKLLEPGDLVIYESTVYPGATEEDCVPVLEQHSGLKYITSTLPTNGGGWGEGDTNNGFYCGYSPERINPGDKQHRLADIVKVTSGSTPEVADVVNRLYSAIITAGTHKAPSIKVAEAAKVIENTQRDLNIALVNELALIFQRLGINTQDVLAASGTKWNFLPFKPGLVGGHCIGVDPYYLTHKAQEVGFHPEMILAGRRLNDSMGAEVANRVLQLMLAKGQSINGSRVLVLGLTFKENCRDVRNTRVIDIISALRGFRLEVDVYDPWIDRDQARGEFGLECMEQLPETAEYAALVLAVSHREFAERGSAALRNLLCADGVLFDVKGALPAGAADSVL